MKFVPKNKTQKIKLNKFCSVLEYPIGDKDINGAYIELKGRYPEKDRVVNSKCKELVYILKGSGKVVVEGKTVNFKAGDEILIEPGEKYFWEGDFSMITPCTPAWYPEQHKEVD